MFLNLKSRHWGSAEGHIVDLLIDYSLDGSMVFKYSVVYDVISNLFLNKVRQE